MRKLSFSIALLILVSSGIYLHLPSKADDITTNISPTNSGKEIPSSSGSAVITNNGLPPQSSSTPTPQVTVTTPTPTPVEANKVCQ